MGERMPGTLVRHKACGCAVGLALDESGRCDGETSPGTIPNPWVVASCVLHSQEPNDLVRIALGAWDAACDPAEHGNDRSHFERELRAGLRALVLAGSSAAKAARG